MQTAFKRQFTIIALLAFSLVAPNIAIAKKKATKSKAPLSCAQMDNTKKAKKKNAMRKQLEALNKKWCKTKGKPYPYCEWGCGGGAQDEEQVPNTGNTSGVKFQIPPKTAN